MRPAGFCTAGSPEVGVPARAGARKQVATTIESPSRVYAELHCLSNFTFLRGASRAAELVERAARLGYAALAITDECSVAGIVRAHVAAKEHGLELIVGAEFRL